MIFRDKSDNIIEFINKNDEHKNVLIVEGVRQVGKTSAVRQAIKKSARPVLEINLETQKLLREKIAATREFSDFLTVLKAEFGYDPQKKQILFIDEANECPRLGHYVRQMKEDLSYQTVILSGSMMQNLFRDKTVRIPVGRYETITIQPFNFAEFLAAQELGAADIKKHGMRDLLKQSPLRVSEIEHGYFLELVQHYLNCGGVPALMFLYLKDTRDERQETTSKAMAAYLSTLKDDFVRLFSVEHGNLFLRTVTTTANLQGYPFKKSILIQNNNRLAENILSVFENWKFIYKIEQKSFQTTDAVSLHPKRYLFDVGVAKLQREMAVPTINVLTTLGAQQREPLGGLIEQMVCCELIHRFAVVCGYKEKGYEIDFVLKTKDTTVPIECKASLKPNQKYYQALDLYHQRFGNKQAVMVSLAPFAVTKRLGYELINLPAYAIGCLPGLLK